MSSEKKEQYWKVQVIKDNPVYPFILVDNWYTQLKKRLFGKN